MYRYGKTTQSAIAVMSRLAQVHADPASRQSSAQIAKSRNLTKPLVAKLLNILAQGKLVDGTPGPTGGYRLARDPAEITLLEVASLFEAPADDLGCAFGPGWCGRSESKCPLHDHLCDMKDRMINFLSSTTFAVFESSSVSESDASAFEAMINPLLNQPPRKPLRGGIRL